MAATPIAEVPLSRFIDEIDVRGRRIPLDGVLETTFRCNLSCVHCYVNQPAGSAEVRARELPLERLLELVDEVADAGCLNLLLTGGEVLCRPDFPELYLHAIRRGLMVTVFTNGTIVTERVADLLVEHKPYRVEITLYGGTRETYERVTQVPGSWDRCLQGIGLLVERGVPLALKTMLLTWNEHELDAMRAVADSFGVPFKHDGLLNARVDCGANRNAELQIPASRLAALDLHQAGLARAVKEGVAAAVAAPAEAVHDDRLYTCGAGQFSFTVDPYGRLTLCQLSRGSGYDLRQGSFERGWGTFLPALREQRYQRNDVCPSCTLRGQCGSCPGAAELEHGDPEAIVAQFCELTHARAHATLGAASGHRADASCCLGRAGARVGGQPPPQTSEGCAGGCGSASAEPTLIPLQMIRRKGNAAVS